MTIHTALQKFRKHTPLQIVKDDDVEEIEEVVYDENSVPVDFLLGCIQELPDRYRLVFNLYVLDKYAHKEIAELLKITVGTSKSNLSRARMILKEKIEVQQKIQKEA